MFKIEIGSLVYFNLTRLYQFLGDAKYNKPFDVE
jgi:hypothetical protein